MRYFRRIVLLATIAAAQGAWAVEIAYDFTACTHTRRTVLEANADIFAMGVEVWGVVAASTSKEWENATTHCVGSLRVMAGKPVGKGVCKWLTAAGDTAVGEFEYPAAGEPAWTWLTGTGKLKGISGRGTFQELAGSKPVQDGTSQGCRRDWGKYTLP